MFIKKCLLLLASSTTLFFSGFSFADMPNNLVIQNCQNYEGASSMCQAAAVYQGNVTTVGTNSADPNYAGLRMYLKVAARGGNGGCFNSNDNSTLGIISYNLNTTFSPKLALRNTQQQQDWRNMALLAISTGTKLTIYTDGNCNIVDMWYN